MAEYYINIDLKYDYLKLWIHNFR